MPIHILFGESLLKTQIFRNRLNLQTVVTGFGMNRKLTLIWKNAVTLQPSSGLYVKELPATAVMAPRTLVEYSLLKDGEGKPLVKPDLIKNMQFFDTTKVPVNQVQGTSGAVCSSILLGGFNELVIGIRSVLEIQVLQEKFADYGQVGYLATMRADTALYQPKSICKILGIKP